jgi:predicted DNA-binding helix-hairpin-helix protein
MTAAEIRAQVEAAKKVAMNRFAADWGTRDVQKVVGALRQTIPTSTSPNDAARKARSLIG